jgi:hypothetical protein
MSYIDICQKELRKTMRNFNQATYSSSQDLNQGSLKYEIWILNTTLWYVTNVFCTEYEYNGLWNSDVF